MSYNTLPVVLQSLIQSFIRHPFQVETEVNWIFWQNQQFGFDERFCWLHVLDNIDELETVEFQGLRVRDYVFPALIKYWEIVSVEEKTVSVQAFTRYLPFEDGHFCLPYQFIPVGEPKQRFVNEEIWEDGTIKYWIALREEKNSGGFGPQMDDEGNFCPEERLVEAEYNEEVEL